MLEYIEMISEEKRKVFQNEILAWYEDNIRDLPWRKLPFDKKLDQRDPYKILISEVMSQQTQLSRVVPKYNTWLEKFPTIQNLANAKTAAVLQYWNGLGYNRRALNLQRCAQKIVQEYNGVFPRTEKALIGLPGIGPYTARALLCFAFGQQVAVIDTNIRKVILTQFDVSEKDIPQIAEILLPHGKAYEWNQALMDYAASVLKKEKIAIPKQSTFIGSHRYYRGQILKLLLKKKKILIQDIGLLIKKDYTILEKEWLEKILDELEKEGFILVKDGYIIFAS